MPNRVLRDWTASLNIDRLTPQAEVFFTRLIMKVDDHGCFYGDTKMLNANLFPLKDYTSKDVLSWRIECQKADIIKIYAVNGRTFVRIIDFKQRLRIMRSKFPQEDESPTNDGQLPDIRRIETNRNESETESETKGKSPSNVFDENFTIAFDEITCDRYKMIFKEIDLGRELQMFRVKCDNDPQTYHHRDPAGLRTAFQYQLKSANKNGITKEHPASIAARNFAERHGSKPNQ